MPMQAFLNNVGSFCKEHIYVRWACCGGHPIESHLPHPHHHFPLSSKNCLRAWAQEDKGGKGKRNHRYARLQACKERRARGHDEGVQARRREKGTTKARARRVGGHNGARQARQHEARRDDEFATRARAKCKTGATKALARPARQESKGMRPARRGGPDERVRSETGTRARRGHAGARARGRETGATNARTRRMGGHDGGRRARRRGRENGAMRTRGRERRDGDENSAMRRENSAKACGRHEGMRRARTQEGTRQGDGEAGRGPRDGTAMRETVTLGWNGRATARRGEKGARRPRETAQDDARARRDGARARGVTRGDGGATAAQRAAKAMRRRCDGDTTATRDGARARGVRRGDGGVTATRDGARARGRGETGRGGGARGRDGRATWREGSAKAHEGSANWEGEARGARVRKGKGDAKVIKTAARGDASDVEAETEAHHPDCPNCALRHRRSRDMVRGLIAHRRRVVTTRPNVTRPCPAITSPRAAVTHPGGTVWRPAPSCTPTPRLSRLRPLKPFLALTRARLHALPPLHVSPGPPAPTFAHTPCTRAHPFFLVARGCAPPSCFFASPPRTPASPPIAATRPNGRLLLARGRSPPSHAFALPPCAPTAPFCALATRCRPPGTPATPPYATALAAAQPRLSPSALVHRHLPVALVGSGPSQVRQI
ncbi:hypothetical protein DENSPDRAFT_849506 [Dentipellis sp. KUC8613]|nr:hypothetical protein DENSPDRAFT_849506 [Dentipellis sp. KUC8613]